MKNKGEWENTRRKKKKTQEKITMHLALGEGTGKRPNLLENAE